MNPGIPGLVMVIHTFGDYARFHPYLHAIVADGLFRKNGTFYVLPRFRIKQLERIFRSCILAMFKRKGKIAKILMTAGLDTT
ncbi:MAG: transposase [Dissulfuribacterales bacterium]